MCTTPKGAVEVTMEESKISPKIQTKSKLAEEKIKVESDEKKDYSKKMELDEMDEKLKLLQSKLNKAEKVVVEKDKELVHLKNEFGDSEKINLEKMDVKVKDLETKLSNAEDMLEEKDKQLATLKKEVDEMEYKIKHESEEVRETVLRKNEEIKLLSEEMEDLGNKIKCQEKKISDLTVEKIDWSENVEDSEVILQLNEALETKEKEVKKALEEKVRLEEALKTREKDVEEITGEKQKMEQRKEEIEKEVEEKSFKIKELSEQAKEIADNAKYLEAELVKQKVEMEKVIDSTKLEVQKKEEEVELVKEELIKRDKEISELKQRETVSPNEDFRLCHGKLDRILAAVESGKIQKEPVNSPRTQQTRNPNIDIQVSRVRSANKKILVVGHPENLRNFENIPTIMKCFKDLAESDSLETITGDYEGFILKNLESMISERLEKKQYSDATKDGVETKISTVAILPGNLYAARAVLQENTGKSKYIINNKLDSAIPNLVTDTVGLVNAAAGGGRKIILVIDPSSDETYEFSKRFMESLSKELSAWKESLAEGERPEIEIYNITEEQVHAGGQIMEKRMCFEVFQDNKSIWLDKKYMAADKSRVSKRGTIGSFNKIIDLATESRAPVPPCKDCGIQQSSSYTAKCNQNDMGEFKLCTTCGKDAHESDACWSMKFQSDRVCRNKYCKPDQLKHNPLVHDIIDKKCQDEVMAKLNQKIHFWDKPRRKRPFFSLGQDEAEAPPKKQRKFK